MSDEGTQGGEGGSAGGVSGWRAQLDKDYQGHPSLASYSDDAQGLNGVVKSYLEAQKLVGKDRVVIPGEKAPLTEVHQFLQKIGRPDDPAGYALDGFDPGIKDESGNALWDKSQNAAHAKLLHEAGLTKAQVAKLMPGYAALLKQSQEQMEARGAAAAQEGLKSLEQKWGAQFPQRLAGAVSAFKEVFGGDDVVGKLRLADGTRLGDNPLVIEAFERLAAAHAQHGLFGDGSQTPSGVETPQQAQRALAEFEGDAENVKILMDNSHPKHRLLTERHDALTRLASRAAQEGVAR